MFFDNDIYYNFMYKILKKNINHKYMQEQENKQNNIQKERKKGKDTILLFWDFAS